MENDSLITTTTSTLDLTRIGLDGKPVVLTRAQLVEYFARRYPCVQLHNRDDPLREHNIGPAVSYVVQWYDRTVPYARHHTDPLPRIITPLDADGLAHGSERYFYETLTSEGGITFCRGKAVAVTKMPFCDSLCANALSLDHIDQINRAMGAHSACKDYRDLCGLGRRAVSRFLLASAGEHMRRVPWELRQMIFSHVLPPELHDHRKRRGYRMLPDGFRQRSWLSCV
ncbi:hypothetical protein pneo_cds_427 [Pandoravirus neocaledonia]|uniref:Uncharacterized protein n=1 Tax=Pandoravirus neocaledonia TaxID=2107708 RepID=A0A2U7UC66_9VIRU|nr:hypothetical protein pneo_cds_427 [Pandoravirus neocaledonia]AVK76034.1 hypothetical protein pneo_cds_427 [Pandoravirus neocaledonia]